MKLKNWISARPVDHPLVPAAQQGFVVGTRGVLGIERIDGGAIVVTMVPGVPSENPKDLDASAAERLVLHGSGAGEILEAKR